MAKRRRINYFRLAIALLVPIVIIGGIVFFISTRPKSLNEEALKYKNKSCVIFYPDNQRVKEYAVSYCETHEKETIDYTVNEFGDYLSVTYPDNTKFIVDKNYEDLNLEIADKKILSEEFIYEYKKSENDTAYTSKFLKETYYENFDVSDIKTTVLDSGVEFYLPKYDFSFVMNYALAQNVLDANFGFEKVEYQKRHYISDKRPKVAITYDDGPYRVVDSVLFELFSTYDSRCTFFIVGNRLGEKELANVKIGIDLGMEYGSHSFSHIYLKNYSVEKGVEEIMHPYKMLDENFGYKMKVFRFPGGSVNSGVEDSVDMESVLWTVDTLDWKYRDADNVYTNIMSDTKDKSIVLMHSLYETTKEASLRAIPELIDKGYQLVTVSELLNLN